LIGDCLRKGKLIGRIVGVEPKENVESKFEKYLE